MVSKKSGLLGVSGLSNDMRDLREAIKGGNEKARLAVDKFTWTIAKWIGSFYAELGGLDMLVFTGGIGENDIASRAEICAGLGALGIVVDPEKNNVRGEAVISAENSRVTGARDSAGRRSDDRESRGAAAGQSRRMSAWRPAHSDPRDCEPLFYTKGFASELSFMHSVVTQVDLKRLPSPALRRFAWASPGVFYRRDSMGFAGTRDGCRRGLRQPLAVVQWDGSAALGEREHDDRVHAPHHQRPFVLLCRGFAGVDICRNRARTPGARGCRGIGRVHAG